MMEHKFSFSDIFNSLLKLIAAGEEVEQHASPLQRLHQIEIENAVLMLAAGVVRCDCNLSEATENHISGYLEKQFGAEAHGKRVEKVSRHVELGTEAFIKVACKELQLLTTYDSRLNILHFLFGVAASDDFINAKELRILQRISGYLGVKIGDFKSLKEDFMSCSSPYAVLEVEEGVSLKQLKSAYRRKLLQFHPDKRKHDLTQREAEEKFREIRRAFEAILKETEATR